MILWVVLLTCLRAAAEQMDLERIKTCSTKCSQGLQCKINQGFVFPPPCQNPAEGLNSSSVFRNISLSTVMSCEKRQRCSLHLRIKTAFQLTESIHGLSICTVTAGMLENCRNFSISKASRKRMFGLQVEVEDECNVISPNQQVRVTVKTLPSYCGVTWTETYHAPACISDDLRRNVPECITGKLSYDINPEKKELLVTVTDMLEDHNYNLRLCHNDFICSGTGADTILIKKEESVKSATLLYSRPLPCLCIEGWSAVFDAPRVQVCPFKERLDELWRGILFDPLEEALSWEPACPVAAVVTLCQRGEDGVCVDLPQPPRNTSREKVTFRKVDPHPRLCMKFTAGRRSWTRCPFADGRFQAWEVALIKNKGREEATVTSQITATFSVGLCVKSAGSPECHTTETHTVHVEEHGSVAVSLEGELCKDHSCLHVTRLDVQYAATVFHCFEQCNHSSTRSAARATADCAWVLVPVGVCLCGVIIVTLLLHVLLTVYQRRKQKRNEGYCVPGKQTDSAVSTLQTEPALLRGVLVPDSQCGNTEKANLL